MALWGLQDIRWVMVVGVGLAVSAVAMIVIDFFIDSMLLNIAALFVYLAFQVLTIWLATEYLFAPGRVTFNKVIGGSCIFFLLGMSWTILYVFCAYLDPSAFNLAPFTAEDQGHIYWDLTYFSFVTITTLGYGDILPLSAIAKALAYIEAVVGQIFVAVLIGALVSTYTGHKLRDN